MAAGPAYAAFISYSRAVDGRLAPRLKGALEGFGKPWYRLRAIRVFRDDASLSANPGLWSSLTTALDRTESFVLLASPGAAASEWVNREVEYWLGHRDGSRLLIVLTDVSGEHPTELWDAGRRRRVATLKENATAFNPTGERLGVLRAGAVELLDPRTARRLGSVHVGEGVEAFAISADGRRLATVVTRTGTADATRTVVELWDVPARRRVGDEPLFIGAESLFPTAQFSPDGRRLLVTGVLGWGVLVFDIDPDAWARRACELAPSCGARPDAAASAARG